MKTLIVWLLLIGVACANPTVEIEEWVLARDGNIIVTYREIDKNGVHHFKYKHAVKTTPSIRTDCAEIVYHDKEIWFLTQEAVPSQHIVERAPNAYQPVHGEDWIMLDPITGRRGK